MESESGFSWAMASQPYNIKHFLGYSREQLSILLVWTWLMHFCPAPQSLCSKHCLISLKKNIIYYYHLWSEKDAKRKVWIWGFGSCSGQFINFLFKSSKFVCLLSSLATHSAEMNKMNKIFFFFLSCGLGLSQLVYSYFPISHGHPSPLPFNSWW